jgi:LemA protein
MYIIDIVIFKENEMKKSWIIIAIVVVLALWGFGSYNSLVSTNEKVDNQWAQVETQYQRRFDLIPNLVETVKGIAEQEQTVFKDLADARARYAGAQSPEARAEAANQVEGALGRLLVVVENYPQLRSQENFLALQSQLEGTENRISIERKRYNDVVTTYNTKVKRFPTNIFASIFGFDPRTYFEAATGAEVPPKVDFTE